MNILRIEFKECYELAEKLHSLLGAAEIYADCEDTLSDARNILTVATDLVTTYYNILESQKTVITNTIEKIEKIEKIEG